MHSFILDIKTGKLQLNCNILDNKPEIHHETEVGLWNKKKCRVRIDWIGGLLLVRSHGPALVPENVIRREEISDGWMRKSFFIKNYEGT